MPTGIPYCDETLEVTGGCTKCSPGCTHCWAVNNVWRMAHRTGLKKKWGGLVEKKNSVLNWTGKIKCFEDALDIPLRRKKPTTYFVDSKADLFHPKVPFEFVDKVLYVMYRNLQHTFQILTKRPERMLEYFANGHLLRLRLLKLFPNYTPEARLCREWPLDNIHLGVSISTQAEADEKIPILLQIPSAVRWLSIEPCLEDIDLSEMLPGHYWYDWEKGCLINWIVVGGESSKGARPMHPDWPRNIRDQCVATNTPFYFKQWGKYFPDEQFEAERKARPGSIMLPWPVPDGQIEKIEGMIYYRVGKKKAGCLLDGKIWKQLPERK